MHNFDCTQTKQPDVNSSDHVAVSLTVVSHTSHWHVCGPQLYFFSITEGVQRPLG